MGDMIGAGARWLTDKLAVAEGTSFRYVRGDVETVFRAVVGRLVQETTTAAGVVETHRITTFTVARDELPVEEPRRGDRIVQDIGSTTITWELAPPDGVPLVVFGAFRESARLHAVEFDRA